MKGSRLIEQRRRGPGREHQAALSPWSPAGQAAPSGAALKERPGQVRPGSPVTSPSCRFSCCDGLQSQASDKGDHVKAPMSTVLLVNAAGLQRQRHEEIHEEGSSRLCQRLLSEGQQPQEHDEGQMALPSW